MFQDMSGDVQRYPESDRQKVLKSQGSDTAEKEGRRIDVCKESTCQLLRLHPDALGEQGGVAPMHGLLSNETFRALECHQNNE